MVKTCADAAPCDNARYNSGKVCTGLTNGATCAEVSLDGDCTAFVS